jgi:glycosyltransferase involved in cell wall biosynthesis
LPHLISAIPSCADYIVVVDNGSTDNTGQIANEAGADVVFEPRRGYGQACLSGITHATDTDIFVFLDADFCDDPTKMSELINPILSGNADFVVSSRMHGTAKKNLSFPQQFGNHLACFLMRIFWHAKYSDLGPFRAVTSNALKRMNMQDKNFGWTVEMQIKARQENLRVLEIQVPYRARLFGQSKVSGTLRGVCLAGSKILYVIVREFLRGILTR